jgi:hypothetical protein
MLRQFLEPRVLWAPRDSGWWIAITFIVGSVLFAAGATIPLVPDLPLIVINIVYLVGSSLYLIGASLTRTHEQPLFKLLARSCFKLP